MSIKFSGNQRFTMPSTPMLPYGTTVASMSLFVRLNATAGVLTDDLYFISRKWASGAKISLRQGYDRRMLVGANIDGGTNIDTRWDLQLGRTYHVALVFDQATGGKVYRDGVLIGSFGAGGVLSGATNNPFRFGFASLDGVAAVPDGYDITLDSLAMWNGYALSSSDIAALRDRTATPAGVAPASLDYYLPLNGTVGQVADIADPAVQDQSGNGYNFTSRVGSPVYEADLVFEFLTEIASAKIGTSGKTVVVQFRNKSSGDLVSPSTVSTQPTFAINGSAPVAPTIAALLQGKYAIFFLDQPVVSGDTVAMSTVDQGINTSQGFPEPVTNFPVENRVGQSLFAAQPGPGRTMSVGWNLYGPLYWAGNVYYADLMKQAKMEWSIPFSTQFRLVSSGQESDDGTGYENLEPGNYTLNWQGDAAVELNAVNTDTKRSISLVSDTFDGTSGAHRRVYRLNDEPGQNRTELRVVRYLDGTTTDIQVYPPGVDPDNPPKWHPRLLERLSGAKVLRTLNVFLVNGSNITKHSDFTPVSYDPIDRNDSYDSGTPRRRITVGVQSIENYSDTDQYFYNTGRVKMLVTTVSDHGLETGQTVSISGAGAITLDDGSTHVPFGGPIRVTAPNQFALDNWVDSERTVQGTQTPGGTVTMDVWRGMPVADVMDLANLTGTDPWICVPHTMPDVEVALLAQEVASLLGAGRKVYVEYSNEHWNFATPFKQHFYIRGQGQLEGLGINEWYTKRSGQVHGIFETELAAAGKQGSLVRYFGSQSASDTVTQRIVDYASANNITVDMIGIAPYYANHDTDPPSSHQAIDVEQAHDVSAIHIERYKGIVAEHKAIADPIGAKIVCYEGGMEMVALDSADQPETALLSRRWAVHPRMRELVLRYFQILEEDGCALFTYFLLDAPWLPYYSPTGFRRAVWSAYIAYDQEAGLGDGSDGKFNNLSGLDAKDKVVSVVGQGVKDWIVLTQTALVPLVGRRRLAGPGSTRAGRGSPFVWVPNTRRAD